MDSVSGVLIEFTPAFQKGEYRMVVLIEGTGPFLLPGGIPEDVPCLFGKGYLVNVGGFSGVVDFSCIRCIRRRT